MPALPIMYVVCLFMCIFGVFFGESGNYSVCARVCERGREEKGGRKKRRCDVLKE